MKAKFETEVDDRIVEELNFWGLKIEDVVRDAMEHAIRGSIRRKTDNLCSKCRKPLESSIPKNKRAGVKEFCKCG